MTKTGSAADRAHAHIRSGILRGEIDGSSMLSENELAAQLSMSRTPVRAALARLQDEGWVTIYAQRGALVRAVDDRELRESAQVRHALEVAGVHHSSSRSREANRPGLEQNLTTQAAALGADDFPTFVDAALAFHRGFVELAENSLMLATYDRLKDRQLLSINQSHARIVDGPGSVVEDHRVLLHAAMIGDRAGFSDLLDRHQDQDLAFGGRPGVAMI